MKYTKSVLYLMLIGYEESIINNLLRLGIKSAGGNLVIPCDLLDYCIRYINTLKYIHELVQELKYIREY